MRLTCKFHANSCLIDVTVIQFSFFFKTSFNLIALLRCPARIDLKRFKIRIDVMIKDNFDSWITNPQIRSPLIQSLKIIVLP